METPYFAPVLRITIQLNETNYSTAYNWLHCNLVVIDGWISGLFMGTNLGQCSMKKGRVSGEIKRYHRNEKNTGTVGDGKNTVS